MRGREEAARAAARPIAFVQGIAASCAIWVAISLVRAFPPAAPDWRTWIATANTPLRTWPLSRRVRCRAASLFFVVAFASLLLSSLVLFFALEE